MNADDSSARDSQRAKVYAAEEFVRTLFDRAAEHGSTSVEFFGTQLTLPPEARFGSLAAVQRYVDDVLALPAVRRQWPKVAPLRVRARRAATAAHYENRDGTGVIAVPDRETADWAMRELVVLHEIAHHLCDASRRMARSSSDDVHVGGAGDGTRTGPRAAGGIRERGCAVGESERPRRRARRDREPDDRRERFSLLVR